MTTSVNNKCSNLKPNAKILSVLLLSLPLLYVSLLRVPPANLLKDTAFWFLISNSIVVIVAADSGLFSSSPTAAESHHAIYDEYVCARSAPPPVPPQRHPPAVIGEQCAVEKDKWRSDGVGNASADSGRAVVAAGKTKLGRSRSEMTAARKCGIARRKVLEKRRSCREEGSEYWRMSDVELNERVEDFITRFNREIRREAIYNNDLMIG